MPESFNTLSEAFAHYTECALATAEGLDMLKTTSQSSRRRAWAIANGMVEECRRHGVQARDPRRGRGNPRLFLRLERPNA